MTRYNILQETPEIKVDIAELQKKTVSIVGLGVIGSNVAQSLIRMGINVRIVDKDRVYEEDLAALSLFSEEQISKFKAKEAKRLLEMINQNTKVKAFHEELVEDNAYLIEADVIVDCSNNMKTSLLIDKAAKGKPIVFTRASQTTGYAFIIQEASIVEYKDSLEKNVSVKKKESILPTTAQITAGIVVNKVIKLLTQQKVEKSMLVINGWNFSVDKVTIRKKK